MTMRIRWSCLLLVLLVAPILGAESDHLYYWNGAVRVETELSSEELQISGVDQAALAAAARTGGRLAEVTATPSVGGGPLGQRTSLRFAPATRGILEAEALRLGKVGRGGIHAVLYAPGIPRRTEQAGVLSHQLSLRLKPGQDVTALAKTYHLEVVERVEYSPDTFILAAKVGGLSDALDAANALYEREGAVFASPLILRQHQRRDTPADPLFATQWHLQNLGSNVSGGVSGNDINVASWWDFAGGHHLGAGINIGMVDDGLEQTHEDLQANVRTDLGINFNGAPGGASDPSPGINDFHGTWTSGLVASVAGNGKGGCGVAPAAHLVGIRLIAGSVTDSQDAQALSYLYNATPASNWIHVSSNSWGPADDVTSDPTLANSAPGPLLLSALQTGITSGRGGKGIVYAWAGGNGQQYGDNMAYDGYASCRYVIAVGAIAPNGVQASYSESGPGLLVCAPGGDFSSQGIVTTDRTGKTGTTNPNFSGEDFAGNYTTQIENLVGTSFAAPLVSGVAALLIEANPALTWRDVQHVLVRTAAKNDSGDSGWKRAANNGYGVAGRYFNHKYGFGRVDATAAATATSIWVLAPAEAAVLTAAEAVTVAIPDNNLTGISRTLSISGAAAGYRIEHVELILSVTHPYRGDLHYQLTSPNGMVSDIPARTADSGANLTNWKFTSAAHWGENPNGTWTLKVADEAARDIGSLTAWSLVIHGYVPHPTPVLSGVSPLGAVTNSGNTPLTVTGSGFVSGVSQIFWDGTPLTTTVANDTQMTATIPSTSLVSSGTHTITAVNHDFETGAVLASSGMAFSVGAAPVFVTINAAVVPIAAQSTNENAAKVFTVVINDADTAANLLTLTGTSSNQAVVASSGIGVTGTTTTRIVTVTPLPDAIGSTTITLTLSDGALQTTTTIPLTVIAVNNPPVAFATTFEARANLAYNGTLTGFDPDVGQTLTATIDTPPAHGTLTNVVASTGAFTYTPTPGFTGLDSFTWHLTDNGSPAASSAAATATLVVTADPSLPRPVITSEPGVEVVFSGGGTWSYTPTVSSINPVTIQVTAPATASGGTVSWPIAAPAAGNHLSFVIVAKDTVTGALDYQQIILRYVSSTVAPN